MSRLFIIILIAMLPLRGWCADRMAIQMASNELAMNSDSAGAASGHRNCPMMSGTEASPAESAQLGDLPNDASSEETQLDQSCQACQLCMALAPCEILIAKTCASQSSTVEITSADRFNSAERARTVKPPIS
jgi:hypothetical protein